MALTDIMNKLCEECNISLQNFNNSNLSYSASGHTLFSTDIIYSNPKGTITSTTLIHCLQTWILSQSSPNLTIAGKALLIDKQCPTTVNAATKSACTSKKMASIIPPTRDNAATMSVCISKKKACTISPITYGGFAIGLLTGTVGTSAVAIIITLW